MPTHTVSVSAEIPAPGARAYAIIADYRVGHTRIVPPRNFVGLDVEEGGVGEGTVFVARMKVFGVPGKFRARVTEPEPGRVLVETDLGNPRATTFTVELLDAGRCRVTIATESKIRGGLMGRLEVAFLERLLRPMFAEELALLAKVAGEPGA